LLYGPLNATVHPDVAATWIDVALRFEPTHEGEKMAKMVTEFLGDGVLMYSSDYPHAESRFPESTNKVLQWKTLGDNVMRKMMWDNANKCFGEP
jgi:predicted TIM-barrel fold metal-dependent hydrolase